MFGLNPVKPSNQSNLQISIQYKPNNKYNSFYNKGLQIKLNYGSPKNPTLGITGLVCSILFSIHHSHTHS